MPVDAAWLMPQRAPVQPAAQVHRPLLRTTGACVLARGTSPRGTTRPRHALFVAVSVAAARDVGGVGAVAACTAAVAATNTATTTVASVAAAFSGASHCATAATKADRFRCGTKCSAMAPKSQSREAAQRLACRIARCDSTSALPCPNLTQYPAIGAAGGEAESVAQLWRCAPG